MECLHQVRHVYKFSCLSAAYFLSNWYFCNTVIHRFFFPLVNIATNPYYTRAVEMMMMMITSYMYVKSLARFQIVALPLLIFVLIFGRWPYTVTPSIDQTLHQFLTLLLISTLLPNLTFYLIVKVFHKIFATGAACQQSTLSLNSSEHLVLCYFRTCMSSHVETNLSWTCLVPGLLSFEHQLVLLFCFVCLWNDYLLIVFLLIVLANTKI